MVLLRIPLKNMSAQIGTEIASNQIGYSLVYKGTENVGRS